MTTTTTRRWRRRLRTWVAVLATVFGLVAISQLSGLGAAQAAPCSTSTGASSCTVGTSLTMTAGTLTLQHSPNLYWSIVGGGYDQYASGSATALTGCTASGGATTCSGGTAPRMMVLDGTGAANGWSVSEYVTGSNLPTGSVLNFNGAGSSTVGTSTVSPIATNPFAATNPATSCDFGSSCTNATAAASCSHAPLGFSTCPSYGVNLLTGTSATAQVDMYSASASTGLGAVCFGSGTATAAGCTGTTPTAFYNMGVKGSSAAGTYTGAQLNLAVTSGP